MKLFSVLSVQVLAEPESQTSACPWLSDTSILGYFWFLQLKEEYWCSVLIDNLVGVYLKREMPNVRLKIKTGLNMFLFS